MAQGFGRVGEGVRVLVGSVSHSVARSCHFFLVIAETKTHETAKGLLEAEEGDKVVTEIGYRGTGDSGGDGTHADRR